MEDLKQRMFSCYDPSTQTLTELAETKDLVNKWIAFVDPCGLDDHPGQPLRNLLIWANRFRGIKRVTFLSIRADKVLTFDVGLDRNLDGDLLLTTNRYTIFIYL